ncbi:DUF262 domain-containing protein [Curtobacterium flaccumfaciens]|uniref:DUF262 domain-containing protein n=1 Tax=Curtobacterium flaccumfaciens TaxID=2035 RepID=UPI00112B3DDF|nr:DUF262 domain-containing protein [Curtobacterium flaccumfaciens]TPG03924.1 DUF262 domain-containing protein [Curtobacterium flaccumfaciens]
MKLRRTDPDIETLVGRIKRGDLDLQPSFQRGEIWDKKRQQRLIDSVLRDWYVPAVHVVKADGRQEVLDGQQRLAALRDFVENQFRIDGNIQPENHFIKSLDGLYFRELPASEQRLVLGYVVPVVELTDYEPEEPNELFFRLNQSYNLTPPEKRNALHGPARDQVRDLVKELTTSGLLDRQAIGFSNARLAYDDIIARACVSIELNTLRRHINNNVVEEMYRRGEGFSASTIEILRTGAVSLLGQINESSQQIKFNKGTLQTWLLFAAASEMSETVLPNRLLEDFERARASVRRGDNDSPENGAAAKILALYDDRASYRVTDVSSVLIRDLAIHLYRLVTHGLGEASRLGNLVDRIHRTENNAQPLVLEFIEQTGWGEPLTRRSLA